MEFSKENISGYPDTREAMVLHYAAALPRAVGNLAVATWTLGSQFVGDIKHGEIVLFQSTSIPE